MKTLCVIGSILVFTGWCSGDVCSQTATMRQQDLQTARMRPPILQVSNEQPVTAIRVAASQTTEPQTPYQAPYFMAYQDGASKRVVIQWQLATEANTEQYIVERSEDTLHFAPIHQIVARGLDGEAPQYRDQDMDATGKLCYYRLRIIDKSGNSFYSPPVAVDMTATERLSIRPTVLNMGSTLRLNTYHYDLPLTVNFFDGGGRMVATYVVSGSSFDVNTTTWTKGLYVYRFTDPHHALVSSGKLMIL